MEVDDPMRYEQKRLETFKNKCWPSSTPVSREKLAKAGFYYAGHSDEVICYACGGKHSGWKFNDKAFAIHSAKYPLCPFVRHSPTCGNVALVNYRIPDKSSNKAIAKVPSSMDVEDGGNSPHNSSPSSAKLNETCCDGNCDGPSSASASHLQCSLFALRPRPTFPDSNRTSVTTATNSPCTPPSATSTSTDRRNGLFFQLSQSSDGSASSRCSSNNASEPTLLSSLAVAGSVPVPSGHVSDMETDKPDGNVLTRRQSATIEQLRSNPVSRTRSSGSVQRTQSPSSSPFFRSVFMGRKNQRTATSTGRQHNHRRSSCLNVEENRLRTFGSSWNRNLPAPELLARYGFFYTGRGDMVKCVFCGGRLNRWCEQDDPRAEHLRHFPQCPFVRNENVGNVPTIPGFSPAYADNDRLEAVHSARGDESGGGNVMEELHAYHRTDAVEDDHEVVGLEFILPNVDTERSEVSIEIEEAGTRTHQRVLVGTNAPGANSSSTVIPQHQSHGPYSFPWTSRHESPVVHELTYLSSDDDAFASSATPPSYEVLPPAPMLLTHRQNSARQQVNLERDHDYDIVYQHSSAQDHDFGSRSAPSASSGDPSHSSTGAHISTLELGPLIRSLLHGTTITMRDTDSEDDTASIVYPHHVPHPSSKPAIVARKPRADGPSGLSHNDFEQTFRSRIEELGIFLDKPCRPDMVTSAARLDTFATWPPMKLPRPAEMAEAGFFYAGKEDDVVCFQCNVTLHNWLPTDNAWTEHARHHPRCQFVLMNKGRNFVNAVLQKYEKRRQSNGGSAHGERSENFDSEPERHVLENAINIVKTIQDNSLLQQTTSAETAKTLQELGSRGVNTASEQISQAVAMGYDEALIVAAVVDHNFALFPSVFELIERMELLRANVLQENHDQPFRSTSSSAVGANATCASPVVSSDVRIDSTQLCMEENRFLKEQRVCKICMDAEVSVVFLPCGHLVSCPQCSPALVHCPICRKAIKGTVRTYMC